MFRCPSCAKVYKLPLNKNYSILANKDMNKFNVVKEPFFKDGNLAKAFCNLLLEVSSIHEAIDFVESKGERLASTNIECPACKEENSIDDWDQAHKEPMDFFDAEHLCGCGGEMWMDRLPYSNKYGLVCDECGWFKPNFVVSGSADATIK